jgi:hypothetical protein
MAWSFSYHKNISVEIYTMYHPLLSLVVVVMVTCFCHHVCYKRQTVAQLIQIAIKRTKAKWTGNRQIVFLIWSIIPSNWLNMQSSFIRIFGLWLVSSLCLFVCFSVVLCELILSAFVFYDRCSTLLIFVFICNDSWNYCYLSLSL